jgi:hypothetical protein
MKRSQLQGTDYSAYYKQYIDLTTDRAITDVLDFGMLQTVHFFDELPESKHGFAYAEGKWTPKEILLHLIDTERVFTYRALTFARSENSELPGFDQDAFVANSRANTATMEDLIKEYTANRIATIALFKSFSENELLRKGTANGGPLSVAAAGYIMCGHEVHHCNVLKVLYM